MPNLNATLDADQFLDGNAHFVNINRHSPDGEIIETLPYALIPLNLLTEEDLERVRRIRQMNYPDKVHKK
jgi:hypothetical protein